MTGKRLAALGCAPHSGWAAVIAVAEVDGHLRVLVRDRITMADPGDREARQPYHAVEGLPVGDAAKRLAAYAKTAERMAHAALRGIVDRLARDGYRTTGVGILESAGRKGTALEAILASHALIHSADGDHFRDALAAAAARAGLLAARVPARDLDAVAVATIGKPIESLRGALKDVGREMGPPWAADQKAAALLAWLLLAR